MKILWITNMPTIYRVHFFNELGKYCDLTVMFERYSAKGIENRWKDSLAINFTALFHKTVDVGREGALGIDLLKVNYQKYDEVVISSYSSPAEMIALCKLKLQKIPYILEVDGGIIKEEKSYKKKLKTFLISGADLYFSTSDRTSKYLKYYGAEKTRIYKYHFTSLFNGDILKSVPTEEDKIKFRRTLGLYRKKMVLAVGQFIHRKGFDVLLRAVPNIQDDVDIVIVGGNITEEYQKIVDTLHIQNVKFISEVSKKESTTYYMSADVFVLPTREDIWGLVINEAMAKGLPIITTNACVAGIELIENNRNGYIFTSENEQELATCLNKLLNDKYACEKMGNNNLARIRKYTLEEMAREHYEVFKGRKNSE